ncbi:MAG: hypothetical protein EVA65_06165 [Oceanococcus sp.]|nr:MAG: hypothetical protein EVA65_06165 [Oceanococcus sp.]
MRCQDVRNLLPELVRGDLNPAAEAMLQGHIEDCRACTGALAREQQLQTSLKAIPVPPMRSDFAARALREASVADRPALRRVLDHPLALAASIVMVCSVAFMLGRGLTPASKLDVVSLPLGQTQMVALKIDAPQAFDHVEFEVALPSNVVLEGQPELREFAWSGQLRAGVNVLSLPLVGVDAAGGQLIATVTYGNTRKSLRIPLSVAVGKG